MLIYTELKQIKAEIKANFPKLIPATTEKEKHARAAIGDIQVRVAEIYAIIQRETANDSLLVTYDNIIWKAPTRIKFILEALQALSLAAKTKLNINNSQNLFSETFVDQISNICFRCYNLKNTLTNNNQSNREQFEQGVVSILNYCDYSTGFQRSLAPGLNQGQIISSSANLSFDYQRMIVLTRHKLDNNYQPSVEQVLGHYPSSAEAQSHTLRLFTGIFCLPNNPTNQANNDIPEKQNINTAPKAL